MSTRPPRAATPIAFVAAIVQAYERYGRNPAGALAAARIAPALLRDPSARITATQMELLSGHAMRELDDEALGWFERRLPWGSYGLLCRASITSPTLGVALRRWCRHHALLTEAVRLELAVDGDTATLAVDERRPIGPAREFCLVTMLRFVHGYACWAVDSQLPLRDAAFPVPAPGHRDVYPLMFPGPVRFDAPRAAMRFDAHYLALPLRRDEAALRAMLQRALPLTVLQYRRDRLLVQRVRELLRREPEAGARAATVAERLHVSVRTLHRHLAAEGASLQSIKDEVRRDLAIGLLQRTSRSVQQVARAVGFRHEKSFSRAFAQWTGQAPSVLREAGSARGRKATKGR